MALIKKRTRADNAARIVARGLLGMGTFRYVKSDLRQDTPNKAALKAKKEVR